MIKGFVFYDTITPNIPLPFYTVLYGTYRLGKGFWTSEPMDMMNLAKEYTVEYRHTGEDVDDVRISFLFDNQEQSILLDRIALRGYSQ